MEPVRRSAVLRAVVTRRSHYAPTARAPQRFGHHVITVATVIALAPARAEAVVSFAQDPASGLIAGRVLAAVTLEAVRVSAPPPPAAPTVASGLGGFEERRKLGIGRFIDRTVLEAWENKRTGDLFSMVARVDVRRVQT